LLQYLAQKGRWSRIRENEVTAFMESAFDVRQRTSRAISSISKVFLILPRRETLRKLLMTKLFYFLPRKTSLQEGYVLSCIVNSFSLQDPETQIDFVHFGLLNAIESILCNLSEPLDNLLRQRHPNVNATILPSASAPTSVVLLSRDESVNFTSVVHDEKGPPPTIFLPQVPIVSVAHSRYRSSITSNNNMQTISLPVDTTESAENQFRTSERTTKFEYQLKDTLTDTFQNLKIDDGSETEEGKMKSMTKNDQYHQQQSQRLTFQSQTNTYTEPSRTFRRDNFQQKKVQKASSFPILKPPTQVDNESKERTHRSEIMSKDMLQSPSEVMLESRSNTLWPSTCAVSTTSMIDTITLSLATSQESSGLSNSRILSNTNATELPSMNQNSTTTTTSVEFTQSASELYGDEFQSNSSSNVISSSEASSDIHSSNEEITKLSFTPQKFLSISLSMQQQTSIPPPPAFVPPPPMLTATSEMPIQSNKLTELRCFSQLRTINSDLGLSNEEKEDQQTNASKEQTNIRRVITLKERQEIFPESHNYTSIVNEQLPGNSDKETDSKSEGNQNLNIDSFQNNEKYQTSSLAQTLQSSNMESVQNTHLSLSSDISSEPNSTEINELNGSENITSLINHSTEKNQNQSTEHCLIASAAAINSNHSNRILHSQQQTQQIQSLARVSNQTPPLRPQEKFSNLIATSMLLSHCANILYYLLDTIGRLAENDEIKQNYGEQLQRIYNEIVTQYQMILEKEKLYYRPEEFKPFFSSPFEVPQYFLSRKEKAKIEFWIAWTRDRLEGRPLYEEVKPGAVVLDLTSAVGNLKIYRDRLTVANPSVLWGSVRASVPVTSGKWYYEVELLTQGLFQIGWATSRCHFRPLDSYGFGVGDDEYSWAVDFQRGVVWNKKSFPYGKGKKLWRSGDIVQVHIDLDNKVMQFGLNGVCFGVAFQNFDVGEGMYPAASLGHFQECRFNFGCTPFRYQPLEGYRAYTLCTSNAGSTTCCYPRPL